MKRTATIFRSAPTRMLVMARAQKRAATLFAVLLAAAASGLAQSGVVIADFNHDGIPDVLLPYAQTGNFTLSFGAVPYGTFQSAAVLVPYPAGCTQPTPASPLVGDFNGDGIPDLAVACYGSSTVPSIYVMLGNGDGTFATSSTLSGLAYIAAGDFNHDGKLDLVAQGANASSSVVLYFYAGNGDGTFAKAVSSSTPAGHYSSLIAVDINNDGYPDLVFGNLANQGANTVDIFGNNKDGSFGTLQASSASYGPSVSIAGGTYPASNDVSVLTGNFFGSGLTDIGIVDTGATAGVFLAKNTSSGNTFSFATPTKTLVPGVQLASAASFVSSYSDLLVSNGATLSVLTNNGQGVFSSSSYAGLTIARATTTFATADANGDGHADIYTATTTATGAALTVNLLTGTATATSAPFSLPAGTAALTATWPGNTNFSGSTATGSQTVNALASVTGIASSLNPAFAGQSVLFSATVAAALAGTNLPTGLVTFTDNGSALGTGMIGTGGVATLTTSALTVGPHTIAATYGGDTIFSGSTNSLSEQVNINVPTLTWAAPTAITYGTALSATQLNAAATNAQAATLAGTFVYTPALGTVLNAGQQTLSVTFTPTNTALYSTVTKTVTLQVNQAIATIGWTPAVTSIVYGTALGTQQLNATATGVGGATVAGAFVYTPASGAVLTAGTQSLGVIFTSSNANYLGASGSASITVTKATPTLTWTTPAAIAYGIPLSAAQLSAAATGATGTALAGAFVYTPAVGAVLTPGSQTLSTTFTPTDLVDYVTATKTVTLTVTDIALGAFTPNTGTIGDAAKTITITGSGFVASTVAQINGVALTTTYVSPTSLTAVIPATNFATTGTLLLTLKNAATGSVSNSLSLAVSAPPVTATYVGPSSSAAASQPVLNLTIPAYPVALTATLTVTATSSLSSGVTDPNVVFANGLTTYTFTIPAGTTTIPTIQLQAGTVAETITVPLVLTANGVNVTPAGLNPVVIAVPAAVPVSTAATLVRSGSQITVTVDGFSNTREIVSASFTFVPTAGASLSTTQISAPVAGVFTTYYGTAASVAAGSSFIYTQVFNVNGDANSVGSVQVTLTNSIGVSVTVTAK